ncbi:MAG: substrate-binding domain-containing protein, partial [Methylobacterium sp.]|nr:substrate-binding domain-containing protein [Methylobacterium sp.]
AGERFLASAERIEAEMLSAQADLAATGLDVSGTVRIGAPDGFGTLFLSPRLGKLASQHPGLIIQLVPVPRAFSLSKREADIAITIDRPEAGRLAIRKLTDYTLHLYAARSYLSKHGEPESREALKAHQLVTYVQDQLFSPALNFMPDLFGPDYRRLECVSAVGQDAAVQAGAGIGILHDYHAARNAGLKMVLPDLVFRRTYWLATHLDTQASLRIRTVADFIVAEVQAHRALFEPEAAARQA